MGPATVALLRDGEVRPLRLDPADFGLAHACRPRDLAVQNREEAVAILKELLAGRGPEAMLDMVALNVGLAIYLLEDGLDLAEAMRRAREAVRAGAGREVLHAA